MNAESGMRIGMMEIMGAIISHRPQFITTIRIPLSAFVSL
jgi:hypothetical protein